MKNRFTIKQRLIFLSAALFFIPIVSSASYYTLPLNTSDPDITLTALFDHDATSSQMTRYDENEYFGVEAALSTCSSYNDGAGCYDGHHGTDWATNNIEKEVYAADAGVVGRVKWENVSDPGQGYGFHVGLYHEPQEHCTVYAHMASTTVVSLNDSLTRSQQVGTSSNTGVGGYHLHFGVYNAAGTSECVSLPPTNQIDPFGWTGAIEDDPWTDATNTYLWTTNPPSSATSTWYNDDWDYRVKITASSTKVTGDVTDFPLYVDLSELPASFHTNVRSDGGDIRVTTTNGVTELPREVVLYNAGSDTGELHFKNTGTLSSSTDTDFYIYYGNSSATDYTETDTYGSEAVWSDYVGVWHLEEASGTRYDSTDNDNDVTENGGTSNGVTSVIGNGVDIDGGRTLSITDASQTGLDLNTYFSATVIASADNVLGHNNVFGKSVPSGNQRAYGARISNTSGNTQLMLYVYPNGSTPATSAFSDSLTYATGTASHFGYIKDGTTARFYHDGSSKNTATTNSIKNSTAPFVIGAERTDGTDGFEGVIDELRIRTDVVSADWVATEYNNLMDNNSFWAVE